MQICSKEKISKDFEEFDSSLALNRALYNFHDILTNQYKVDVMIKYMDKFYNCLESYNYDLKLKNQRILNRITNYTLYQYFKKSKYLYRGTKTEELDNMLESKTLGVGGGDYNFVCLSLFFRVAMFFTRLGDNYDYKKHDRVIIQFHKNKIKKEVVFQGYNYKVYKDSRKISNPQGFKRVDEAEVRIPKGIKYDNTIKQLIFVGIVSDIQKQHYIEKYSKIAPVIFLRDKDFDFNEETNTLKYSNIGE